ncbi:hypothetical protein JHK82_027492 [Glycine max]|nr:hypothetical protein JHK86_027619 [Glycine max]KAG5126657.1 hypothetical protein JHK82_027492 [Glycine max]
MGINFKKSDPSFDDLMLSATANYLRLSKSIIVLKNWGEYLPSSKSLEFLDEIPATQNIAPGKVPPVAIIISHQNLRGDVSSISRLKALKWLDLSNTDFHGLIPPTFGNLFYLEYLDLSSNKFEGSIPPKLGALRSLKTLNLSNNLLVGEIPKELQGLESLQDFQIFNNHLSGLIPSWVGNWTNLRVFAAYENNFDGRVPSKLGFIYELKTLNLHSNHLEGPIPGRIFTSGKLEVLILTQNNLSCDLPVEIGNCQTLFSVRIGNNNLEGLSVHLTRQSCPLGQSYCKETNLYGHENNALPEQDSYRVIELRRLRKLSHENVMKPIGYVICSGVALLIHHQYLPDEHWLNFFMNLQCYLEFSLTGLLDYHNDKSKVQSPIGFESSIGGVSLLDRPSNNSSSVLVKISRSSIVTRSKEAAGDAAFVAKKLLRSTGKATFAVRIPEAEIPNLIKTLRGFNDTKIEFKLANVQKIWQRFLYRDSVLLEAERRKTAIGHVDDWAVEFLKLTEDDAFATLIQILHYKLHNDRWRKQVRHNKQFGLPHQCLVSTS